MEHTQAQGSASTAHSSAVVSNAWPLQEPPVPSAPASAADEFAKRAPPHGCGGCDRRWSGMSEAHCKQCHEHFGSDYAFDRHLVRHYTRPDWDGRGPAVRCVPVAQFSQPMSDRSTAPRLVAVRRAGGVVWVSKHREDAS